MGIVPGEEPRPVEKKPLLADGPLPPGDSDDIAEDVEDIDRSIRAAGSDEIAQADEQADAAEGDAKDAKARQGGTSAGSDADEDPTSDKGVDPEDPEAQEGANPGSEEVIDAS